MFLEECRYVVKKKIAKYIMEDIEISSDSVKKILMKKIQKKKILVKKILIKKIIKKNTQMKKIKKYFSKFFFLNIKMVNKYCQKHNEKLRNEARERYQFLFEEEKDEKRSETDIQILLKDKSRKYLNI